MRALVHPGALQAAGVEVGTVVRDVPGTDAIVRMARELLRSNHWPRL